MRLPSIVSTMLIGVWLAAIGAGLAVLLNYEYAPGAPGVPPAAWPDASKIKPDGRHAILVMVAHPHCTCTRASINELSQLMTAEQGKLAAYVLFWSPQVMPGNWAKTDLWQSASAIPGVTVVADVNGVEANRFRASTSGQTMVYSPAGKLLFSGGITLGRGHIGDNTGLEAVKSILCNRTFPNHKSLVFGCSLVTPSSKERMCSHG